ncbi:MAG TPA: AMP-binding protein [Methylophilaceae bacterium]|nr:AMP-binding protein [Methylophilaceae bacterium]
MTDQLITKFPLLTHHSLEQTVAWYKGRAVSVAEFLMDVTHLATTLPTGSHILNVCNDRYHFTVGLAAAIVSGRVSLLPPTNTPEMVRQLRSFSADIFCLHDTDDCEIDLPSVRYSSLMQTLAAEQVVPKEVPLIDSRQQVAVLFTSGSTATPIPHPKTWGSLVRNIQAQAERLGMNDGVVRTIIGTVPPQHMYGLESTVLLPLQSGNILSSARPFYPADICNAIEDVAEKRMLVSSPVHLRLLLDAELALPKVEKILCATAPLSPQLAESIEERFAAPLFEIYGSTETGQIASRRTVENVEWRLFPEVKLTLQNERMWASDGHVEIPAPLNDVIELTSPSHFLLYGRMTDLINIAGKRNSLVSLNHHLNSIPGVIDGAFFVPHEDEDDQKEPSGQVTRLSACVVAPTLTAGALMSALRERIDPVFLPRPLLFLDALPRNSTGKLTRASLKALFNDAKKVSSEVSADSDDG